MQVTLDVVGDRKLPEPVAAGLYLIAQEALTNVTKHAGVNEATVRLRLVEGAASLEVEDHGRGFSPQAGASERGHLGLAGMAERGARAGLASDRRVAARPRHAHPGRGGRGGGAV